MISCLKQIILLNNYSGINIEVKTKPVELIELFYDLIFVYAISKLTALISEPIGGIIPPYNFFAYLITSFVILQAWLYFTLC